MKRATFINTITLASAALFLAGCKSDSISRAEKAETHAPGFAETRAIASQGLIYGLPLVMNYAVNYAFWIDTNSSQYKCPMGQIYNESRTFTYKDTAVVTPNSARRIPSLASTSARNRMSSPCRRWKKNAIFPCNSPTGTRSTTATSAAAPRAMRRAIT